MLLVALIVAVVGNACDRPPAQAPVRNVLLLVVDTLRADRLGCYGHARGTSPNIDALAARGALYENCHAQGSTTRYSMLSLMSGTYVSGEEDRLPAECVVLAEKLQQSGKTTAAFVGNKLLAVGSRGYQRGFDYFEQPEENPETRELGNSKEIFGQFTHWYSSNKDSIQAGKGFFAWVHVMDPHLPYSAPQSYRSRLAGPLPDAERLRQLWADPETLALLSPRAAGAASKDVAAMLEANNHYDAEVSRVDEHIGQLLDFLQSQGELDDTLIIFAADHGEMLWDRKKYPEEINVWMRNAKEQRKTLKELFFSDHGWSFHQELWRTPLILAGPGIPPGVRRTGLAANLDIYPTVLQAVGLESSDALHGNSLLGGVESGHDRVFAYTLFTDAVLDSEGWKLVDRRRKLVEMYKPEDVVPESRSDAVQLFDLKADPLEQHNVAAQHPERVAAMSKLLRDWKKENERVTDDSALTDEDMQALIELGYIEDARLHGAVIPDEDR